MEKHYSSTDHPAVFDPALSLPHFDDEATLLSARPVVSLHEVKAETRSRRRVIFGLTILAAILLGAISATLLMMQSGQNSQSEAKAEVRQPTVSSSGAAGGSTAEARMPELAEPDKEPQMIEVPSVRNSSIKTRPTAAISRGSVKPARAASPEQEDDAYFERDDRELRRAERRDARREARRQRRDKREQMGDDLMRIREIFEGSPRP
jgi:hypothetical protein